MTPAPSVDVGQEIIGEYSRYNNHDGSMSIYRDGKFISAIENTTASCRLFYDMAQEITALKAENEKLRVNLNTCKNDYWFMSNLLEQYSTDIEQAIKDCIERMKFRKPIFNILDKEIQRIEGDGV